MKGAALDRAASVLWFRRDLRLHDDSALVEAALDGPFAALFVLDEVALRDAGPLRLARLYRALQSLDSDLQRHGGALTLRTGKPDDVVPEFACEVGRRPARRSSGCRCCPAGSGP